MKAYPATVTHRLEVNGHVRLPFSKLTTSDKAKARAASKDPRYPATKSLFILHRDGSLSVGGSL